MHDHENCASLVPTSPADWHYVLHSRYWILQFPMHFDLENGLAGALREFQSALTPTSAELVDLSQVPSYDWMRHVSVRNSSFVERQTSMSKQHSRKVSLVFNHLEPMQLAEHITYLEHKVIRRITVSVLEDVLSVYL